MRQVCELAGSWHVAPHRPRDDPDVLASNELVVIEQFGEAPDGWTAACANESDVGQAAAPSNIRLSLFGTAGETTAPVLQLA